MARAGEVLVSPINGKDKLVIRATGAETGGALLEMDAHYTPGGDFPPLHHHPEQDEHFTVLSGAVAVRTDAGERLHRAGEAFAIPRGTPHTMRNAGAEEASVRWQVRPALATLDFYETLYRLAREGKTDATGRPGLLRLAVLLRAHAREFVPSRPPAALQSLILAPLAALGRLLGQGIDASEPPVAASAGGGWVTLTEAIAIERPAAAIFAFVSTYPNDTTWRAGVIEMRQDTPGPARTGTVTHEVIRALGQEMTVPAVITVEEPGRRVAFAATGGPFLARGYREVTGDDRRCLVTYHLAVRLTGAYRLIAPLLRASFRRRTAGDLRRLKAHLESTPTGADRRE
jgi:quercetin dioxygenase-like cupin family protein